MVAAVILTFASAYAIASPPRRDGWSFAAVPYNGQPPIRIYTAEELNLEFQRKGSHYVWMYQTIPAPGPTITHEIVWRWNGTSWTKMNGEIDDFAVGGVSWQNPLVGATAVLWGAVGTVAFVRRRR